MRALIQRVKTSWVVVNDKEVARIGMGLNVLLGIGKGDTEEIAQKMAHKILHMRIFEDDGGKMNLSVLDVKGEILVVPQFTLYANTKRGRRPSFEDAEEPSRARELFQYFTQILSQHAPVKAGVFGADMDVFILNWGPVTFLVEI
ncbi:D-tyrosyl-tRNA(Tyr) deacylase [Thermocrinis albus DSM 14484]|uniref:D-aminoacyl-tRNA deacylase n=1 Tax=Thermocrinis albus (strain DSM 14484 / JCM 11386 / HI 11/12) TaxID=638303 RepID=D3SN01_THEAH|nr:D-aminoacyl-tRNA deacylase [Thermocrinis albus]ADC90131.1 D-tyrosyl-tRNA(Tyr) deacylase [Thermocrinis albus DSM 14484]